MSHLCLDLATKEFTNEHTLTDVTLEAVAVPSAGLYVSLLMGFERIYAFIHEHSSRPHVVQ